MGNSVNLWTTWPTQHRKWSHSLSLLLLSNPLLSSRETAEDDREEWDTPPGSPHETQPLERSLQSLKRHASVFPKLLQTLKGLPGWVNNHCSKHLERVATIWRTIVKTGKNQVVTRQWYPEETKRKCSSLRRGRRFETLWTVAHQAPLPTGFSRQEYWSGLTCPSSGDLPRPGIEPGSPAFQGDSLLCKPPGRHAAS